MFPESSSGSAPLQGADLPHSLDGMKQSEFLSQIVVCILCYLSVLCIMWLKNSHEFPYPLLFHPQ